jgi:hypothetical protein
MSRTTLCALTAALLAVLSLGLMGLRYHVLGADGGRAPGPNTWQVTLAVAGVSQGDARLQTALPLDLDRQHVLHDRYESDLFVQRPPDARHPGRRQVAWTQRTGSVPGPFKVRCTYQVALAGPHSNGAMPRAAANLYAAPAAGEHLEPPVLAPAERDRLSEIARDLAAGLDGPADVAEALYVYVDREVRNDPTLEGPAGGLAECLKSGGGDCSAKARLLTALLRSRGIPSRLVAGLNLTKGQEQRAHYWVEAFVQDHWLPMCPFYHHFGRVPSSYLVFGFGEAPMVAGRHVTALDHAFLVEKIHTDAAADASPWQRAFHAVSLFMLPPAERQLVEVLLLLPVAALIICVFRNIVGLSSFGTFAPALIGLAFHEINTLPGILVFVTILLVGWLMRRVLDYYHLLQVPRVAVMLTLIMGVLITAVIAAHHFGAATTAYISLFPMVILTGMVERFWTLETEDGLSASFKTLIHTMFISTVIALVLGRVWLVRHLFRYPETLGLIMAVQLLIGRYTGYRLSELLRFRDFLTAQPPSRQTTTA